MKIIWKDFSSKTLKCTTGSKKAILIITLKLCHPFLIFLLECPSTDLQLPLSKIYTFWSCLGGIWASHMVLVEKNPLANIGDVREVSSIPGSGRSPRGGHGNSLQCSCLENPMDKGARWATAKGRKDWSNLACTHAGGIWAEAWGFKKWSLKKFLLSCKLENRSYVFQGIQV